MRKKVALILDNIYRDLDGICILASELKKIGLDTFIVPFNLMQHELYFVDFDYVLFNFYRKYNVSLIKELLNSGVCVGVLDTEGGIFSNLENFFKTWPSESVVLEHPNFSYFFWGKKLFNLAINGFIKKGNAKLTGCPRFDVYKQTYLNRIEGDYILFNTNYSFYSPKFSTGKKELMSTIRMIGNSAFYKKIFNEQKIERNETVNLIKYISSKTSKKIIIRPHPFENSIFYEKIFKTYNNVSVEIKGTVKNAIDGAFIVIQRGCSTGLEARLMGKVTISPDWHPYSHKTVADKGNIFIKSKSALLKYIINYEKKRKPNRISLTTKKQIEDYLYKNDGKSSYRVAIEIKKQMKSNGVNNFSFYFFKFLIKRFIYLPFNLKYYKLKGSWKNSSKYFDANTINSNFVNLNLNGIKSHHVHNYFSKTGILKIA